jgi:hypothetical protein
MRGAASRLTSAPKPQPSTRWPAASEHRTISAISHRIALAVYVGAESGRLGRPARSLPLPSGVSQVKEASPTELQFRWRAPNPGQEPLGAPSVRFPRRRFHSPRPMFSIPCARSDKVRDERQSQIKRMPRSFRHMARSISRLSPIAGRPEAFLAIKIASLMLRPEQGFWL